MPGKKYNKVVTEKETQPYATEKALCDYIYYLKSNDRLTIIVLVDGEDETLGKGLFNRVNQKKERHAILVTLSTLQKLVNTDIELPENVTLYITAHGAPDCTAHLKNNELAKALLPLIKKYPTINQLKLASCYSGEYIDTKDIPLRIQNRLDKGGLLTSLAKNTSVFFSQQGLTLTVIGYRGEHFEGRKKREIHSWVTIDKKEFRASDARVEFKDGELKKEPHDPTARQLAGSYELVDGETHKKNSFKLTY